MWLWGELIEQGTESRAEEKWFWTSSFMNPHKLLNLSGTLVSQRASETWDSEVKQIYVSNFAIPLWTPDYWVQSPFISST